MIQTIRQKAEAILKEKFSPEELATDTDLVEILHELQVHQIELELQNDELRRTQAELRATEKKYFDLFNFAPVGYFTLDKSGVIVEVNLVGAELLGKERGDLKGKPLVVYLDSESRPQFFHLLEEIFKYRASKTDELTIRSKNGAKIHLQIKGLTAAEAEGNGYCRLTMTDITERKQIEEAMLKNEALSRAVINALSANIAVLDEQGNIIAINNNWLRFGFENGAGPRASIMEGANYLGVCEKAADNDPIARQALEGIRAVLRGRIETFTLEYPCHSPDEQRWFTMRVTPLTGDHSGVVAAHENITERKQAEDALLIERASLASRVEERTAELREANGQLGRALQLKDEFLANMSHELRTPLNVILGNTELLQDQFYGSLTPKQARAIGLVESSGQHLLNLISDILDLSKIEAGKLALYPTLLSVRDVCEAGLDFVKQSIQAKGIRLTKTFDVEVTTIRADELRFKQILVNLLTNAVKFTPEGGSVGLEIRGDAENERVDLVVWDTGIGIAEAHLAQMFEPFVQLDGGLNRHEEGTGLGLSLVWRLTEMHGGSVSVESKPGKGSRFIVSLPWQTSDPLPATVLSDPHQLKSTKLFKNGNRLTHSTTPLVLLVEDNETNITTMSGFLEYRGYRLVIARNGFEAIEQVQNHRPDIILMDIQMPGMDGLEATQRLRADSETAQVPIIALTALAMPGDRERCLAAGVDEYLSKPVRLKHLVQLIEANLEELSRQMSTV